MTVLMAPVVRPEDNGLRPKLFARTKPRRDCRCQLAREGRRAFARRFRLLRRTGPSRPHVDAVDAAHTPWLRRSSGYSWRRRVDLHEASA